jgi:type IV secretory pathway protease TraF
MFTRPAPLIIFNASASAPVGFYRGLPENPMRRGDLVLVETPASVRELAAQNDIIYRSTWTW